MIKAWPLSGSDHFAAGDSVRRVQCEERRERQGVKKNRKKKIVHWGANKTGVWYAGWQSTPLCFPSICEALNYKCTLWFFFFLLCFEPFNRPVFIFLVCVCCSSWSERLAARVDLFLSETACCSHLFRTPPRHRPAKCCCARRRHNGQHAQQQGRATSAAAHTYTNICRHTRTHPLCSFYGNTYFSWSRFSHPLQEVKTSSSQKVNK